jgi:serine phosphatase RsbU (regulator of sigma subunit)
MNPAAEIQQSLLPPRVSRLGAGEVGGSVLPSYDVGGDWFDYVENRDGAWIAIADAAGKGPVAGGLGSVALAALRAARRNESSLEEAAQTMHETIHAMEMPEFYVTAVLARWEAVYSVLSWVNCGHPPPLLSRPDGSVEERRPSPPFRWASSSASGGFAEGSAGSSLAIGWCSIPTGSRCDRRRMGSSGVRASSGR